ncbi:MAG: hypothetical protein HQL13_02440 [Candidatus Omnitrophica bacterium]|nr:hypothetical protein [Candidatus Omnitrophota bacterium]
MSKLDSQTLSTTLIGSVVDTFQTMCKETLGKNPTVKTSFIEWEENGFMRAFSYSKMYSGSYISFIHFYRSESDKARKKQCGVIIVYMIDLCIMKILPKLGFPKANFTNDAVVADMVGKLCHHIADGFINKLSPLGYNGLAISTSTTFRDLVPGGVPAPRYQKEYHELTVHMWDVDPVKIDIVLDF